MPIARSGKLRIGSLIAGSILAVFAITFLIGGTWALWLDRVDRDSHGFVTIGNSTLTTPTYALEAPLTGDGPSWLYGSRVFGTGRVRATSESAQPLFVGIARTRDISRYLSGTGYGTIVHLASNEVTNHNGGAQSIPPSQVSIWAASTQGSGRQTLLWKPRDGNWSIVMMNADASAGVALRGSLAAKMPPLPWVAAVLLLLCIAIGGLAGWLIARGTGLRRAAPKPAIELSEPTPDAAREEVNA